jgi:formiminotetrahydrofolate cyclodeaminase
LGRIADGEQAPGSGSAAAFTVALAAALVAMVARCSRDSWEQAPGVAAQALALEARAEPLVHGDAEAWQQALAALRGAREEGTALRNEQLEQKLDLAAAMPLRIAETGADVAALAVHAAESAQGLYSADAVAAALLAAAAARAASHLVSVNLGIRDGDERLARARASEKAAADAAAAALDVAV